MPIRHHNVSPPLLLAKINIVGKPNPGRLHVNSFTAMSVLAGSKNSCFEGFWLEKHAAHKHPHRYGAICSSSNLVLMVEHTPSPGASAEWFDQGCHGRVEYWEMCPITLILLFCQLIDLTNLRIYPNTSIVLHCLFKSTH